MLVAADNRDRQPERLVVGIDAVAHPLGEPVRNTARSRLDDIVLAMGGPPPPPPPPVDRRAVLDRLSSGELIIDEAMRILRGEAKGLEIRCPPGSGSVGRQRAVFRRNQAPRSTMLQCSHAGQAHG